VEALLPEALYDLAADVVETTDVIGKHLKSRNVCLL